jgi:hypothetical protein
MNESGDPKPPKPLPRLRFGRRAAQADAAEAAPEAGRQAKAEADAAKPEKPEKKAKPHVEMEPIDPKVYGETRTDRITSAMMSGVFGVCLAIGWLAVMILTQQSFATGKEPKKVEIIEVEGGGGGTPDGELGATEAVNISGADAAAVASNNMEDASAFEEPSIEQTSSAVIDALADVPADEIADVDIADALPNAGLVASGKRASKLGTGRPYGFGPGPGGGVPREQRWSLVWPPNQTIQDYALALDVMGVELATPSSGGTLDYVKNFLGTPTRRTGLVAADKRLYFLWQGAGRKSTDVQLLQNAGIQVGNKPIFQFIPEATEEKIVQAEVQFQNKQPVEIRKTRFQIIPKSRTDFDVKVISQELMY